MPTRGNQCVPKLKPLLGYSNELQKVSIFPGAEGHENLIPLFLTDFTNDPVQGGCSDLLLPKYIPK